MLDVFHVLVSARLVSVGADWSGNVDNFSWLISRCYHALILMMGTGILLARPPLPPRHPTHRHPNTSPPSTPLLLVLLSALPLQLPPAHPSTPPPPPPPPS